MFRLKSSVFLISLSFAANAAAQYSTEEYTYDALGQLIVVEVTGGQNNDEVHSICYDSAGNRTEYTSTNNGTAATCTGGSAPPLPPPPSNYPPVANTDSASVKCWALKTVDLTVNDTDPDNDLPLTITALQYISGDAFAEIVSVSSVQVTGADATGPSQYQYTITDSRGASSSGILDIATTNAPTCF